MTTDPAASAVMGARFAASLTISISFSSALAPARGATATFEDLSPTNPYGGPGGGFFENGSSAGDGSANTFEGTFSSGGVTFHNSYTLSDFGGFTFDSWEGFAYSTTTDSTTEGFGNQYSAFPGSGAGRSATYAVGFGDGASIMLPPGFAPVSLSLTNTTYAALSMRNGDMFAKKFGGQSGMDPDSFSLSIEGFARGAPTGSITHFLADFRFGDSADDYIVDTWETVDLTGLGNPDEIRFALNSSDVSGGFSNTPSYFALDDFEFTPIPEPTAMGMLTAAGLLAWRRRR